MTTRIFVVLGFLCSAFAAHATTYQFSAPAYGPAPTGYLNFTPPCTHGSYCGNYDATMRVTGSFTTASPLAANLVNAEIYPQVTSFRFTDGIAAYDSSFPFSRVNRFRVTTNAAGQITGSDIIIMNWQDGGAGPHVGSTNRFDTISVVAASAAVGGLFINANCDIVGPGALVADDCVGATFDDDTSFASSPSGTWTTLLESTAVPTLSESAVLVLSGLLILVVLTVQRRSLQPTDRF